MISRCNYADIDECIKEAPLFEDVCPFPNEECINQPGLFSCKCIDGYVRSDPHKECESLAFIDIRENVIMIIFITLAIKFCVL